MLKDITIGQFFPGNSLIHRLDPRFKIVITFIFIIMLFVGSSPLGLLLGGIFTVYAITVSRIKLKLFVKSIKPIMPFLIITCFLYLTVMFILSGDFLK